MLKELGIKKQYCVLLALRTPFETARNLINAVFLKLAFDAIGNSDKNQLLNIFLLFCAENVLLYAYNGTIWRFFATFYAKIQKKLKILIIENLLKKTMETIDKLASGDVLTRLNSDCHMACAIYGEPWNLVFLCNGIANLLVSSILFCLLNWKLFLIVMAFVIPHVLISSYVLAPAQYGIQNKLQKLSAELVDMYESYLNLADLVFLYDCSDFLLKKMENKNTEIRNLNIRRAIINGISAAILPLFGLSGYLVLMLCGAHQITAGLITFGTLMYACQLRGGILPTSMMIINSFSNISMNKAGMKRIQELL